FISMNPFTFGNEDVYEAALGEDDRTLAWERATGRSVAAYSVVPQIRFKPTLARFGGQIIEESLVNNVNRFRPEDPKVYPSEYGRIRYLIQVNNQQVDSVGSILLAIGEREAWSIYVNRTTIEDLSGRTQVALSTRVLGSFNTLLGSHGTLNPESVAFNRGRVYWWDALNGTWVRYGRDGLTALSKYKMRGWFKDLGQLLSPHYHSDEIPLAISGYDPRNEMLVTRQDHSGLPATFRGYSGYKGATFSEDDVRWKDIHDLDPEMFADINDQMVSFKEGSLFLHEQTDEYNTFYGTKYDSYIEPVFNPTPKENKVWESINIVSTDGWSVERIIGEYRGASRLIQQSVIPLDNFEAAEDMFWAAIL